MVPAWKAIQASTNLQTRCRKRRWCEHRDIKERVRTAQVVIDSRSAVQAWVCGKLTFDLFVMVMVADGFRDSIAHMGMVPRSITGSPGSVSDALAA
jgi:hypothetical protein